MPRPRKGPRLGGSPSHQKKILANLTADLIIYGKITTTLSKAKVLRPYAEKMISRARTDSLHAKRTVMKSITNREAVAKLFDEVGPRYAERPGGYTRITKLGPRRGDATEEAIIELV